LRRVPCGTDPSLTCCKKDSYGNQLDCKTISSDHWGCSIATPPSPTPGPGPGPTPGPGPGPTPGPFVAECKNVDKCATGDTKKESNQFRKLETMSVIIGLILLFMALFRCLKVLADNTNN